MALSEELQQQLELANTIEATRHSNALLEARQMARLEAVRIAQVTLVENARSKPVSERDITAADVTAFADTIVNYVD